MIRSLALAAGLLFLGIGAATTARASDGAGHGPTSLEGERPFNPGELIFHHISDAHDWHFATIGGRHMTIYLPIIAFTPGEGIEIFSSSHLHAHPGTEGHDDHAATGPVTEASGNAANNPGGVGVTVGTPAGKTVYRGLYLDEHEHLHRVDGQPVYDLSITKNVASMLISVALLFGVFFTVSAAYKRNPTGTPKGLQSLLEPILVFVRDEIARPNIGEKHYRRYLPYLLTVFFFIWFNNLLGLIPGGANLTGNIAVTLTLAVLTFIITTFSGNKEYWGHVFNTPGVPWWLKLPVPLMPAVEFIGLFTKPFSLMIRLFANITAGHIIILSLLSLIFIFQSYAVGVVSSVFVVAMTMMELLVALIQAYVFTLLTAMYFGGAVAEHHHDEHHDEAHAHGHGDENPLELSRQQFGPDQEDKAAIRVAAPH